MTLRVKVIFPDGDVHELEAHEVVVEEDSAIVFVRDGQIVLARDDSGEKG